MQSCCEESHWQYAFPELDYGWALAIAVLRVRDPGHSVDCVTEFNVIL